MIDETSRPLRFDGRGYAAFLFDMDGTMIDSTLVAERIWSEWAERNGADASALLAAVHGVRAVDTVRRFARAGTDAEAEAIRLTEAEIAAVDGILPVPGIEAFIAMLPADRWAVVTSAPRALAEARFRAAGLPVPATMVAAEDVRRGKPDPEGYLNAAALLGVAIGACLVFEDAPAGIAAAKAAGADVVAVGGQVDAEGCVASIMDYRGGRVSAQ
ncbi:MAG: HAD-IA family hydrolase [Sphingopyxis sp.]|nr:HAD-IA family hydrolase [Sphingopyxis sp.]